MNRLLTSLCFLCLTAFLSAADIIVHTDQKLGSILPMNGVNNGPVVARKSQTRGNEEVFAQARIPFTRTHDASFSEAYGMNHIVDITSIFPDFSKDPDKAESYDFTLTDLYLKSILDCGSQVFFRLGQKIEHYVKKYGIMPPKDYKKWAVICEHIIRHYNEGWAEGHHWNIQYWEIWNEPDLDVKQWNTNPRTWGGSEEEFLKFYPIAAKYLKKRYPNLRIGGPALADNLEWAERFLARMQKEDVPMDFFSWHIYTYDPNKAAERARKVKSIMEKYGYGKAESILNEWNYIRNWSEDFLYSVDVMHNAKGAAFNAATMTLCQQERVDMLNYYDARPETPFNGLWDLYDLRPTRAYYPFYIWGQLSEMKHHIASAISENDKDLYCTAALSEDGNTLRLMLTRYHDNDNISTAKEVVVRLAGKEVRRATAHYVDSYYFFTQVPLSPSADGSVRVKMQPNAVVYLEMAL